MARWAPTGLIVVLLGGCGGGSVSTGDTVVTNGSTPTVTQIETFADGSGTVVGTVEFDGSVFAITGYVPDAAADISDLSASSGVFDLRDATFLSANAYGSFFSVAQGGETATVYQANSDGSLILYGEDARGRPLMIALAEELSDLPRRVAAEYQGTTIVTFADGSPAETGPFTMTFRGFYATADLAGSTDSTAIVASDIPVGSDGRFQDSSGTLTVDRDTASPRPLPVSILGGLTGADASGVSGIFVDTAGPVPEVIGGFDG